MTVVRGAAPALREGAGPPKKLIAVNKQNEGGANNMSNTNTWTLDPAQEAYKQIMIMLKFNINPLSKDHRSYFSTGGVPHYVNQMILPPNLLLTFDEVGERGGRVKQGAKGFKLLRKKVEIHPLTGEEVITWSYRVYFTLGQTTLTKEDVKDVRPSPKTTPKLTSDNELGKIIIKLRATKGTDKSLEVTNKLIAKATPEELWEALQSIRPIKSKVATAAHQAETVEVI